MGEFFSLSRTVHENKARSHALGLQSPRVKDGGFRAQQGNKYLHRANHIIRGGSVDATRSFPCVYSFITGRSKYTVLRDPALSRGRKFLDLFELPTLRRTWHGPRRPEPPCAFEVSMIREFCNSH